MLIKDILHLYEEVYEFCRNDEVFSENNNYIVFLRRG